MTRKVRAGDDDEAFVHDKQIRYDIDRLILSELGNGKEEHAQFLRLALARFYQLSSYFIDHPEGKFLTYARLSRSEYVAYRTPTLMESFKSVMFGAVPYRFFGHSKPVGETHREQDALIIQKLYEGVSHFSKSNDTWMEAEDVKSLADRLRDMTAYVSETPTGLVLRWVDGHSRVLTFAERVRWRLFKIHPSELTL